jgi:hypothetical protein
MMARLPRSWAEFGLPAHTTRQVVVEAPACGVAEPNSFLECSDPSRTRSEPMAPAQAHSDRAPMVGVVEMRLGVARDKAHEGVGVLRGREPVGARHAR